MGITKGLSFGVASCCSVVHAACIWDQPLVHVAYVSPKAISVTCDSVASISPTVGHSASNAATSEVPLYVPVRGLRDVTANEVF